MQHKLSNGPLLDEKGNLNEAGYAFSLVKQYQRKDIKARKGRIKEWDYYFINDEEYGVALTIDDNSYMGMASVSVLPKVSASDDFGGNVIRCKRAYWRKGRESDVVISS